MSCPTHNSARTGATRGEERACVVGGDRCRLTLSLGSLTLGAGASVFLATQPSPVWRTTPNRFDAYNWSTAGRGDYPAGAAYFGGSRIRSQVLDHSSRDVPVCEGFHIDMHSL
jgi:hypothetical protein